MIQIKLYYHQAIWIYYCIYQEAELEYSNLAHLIEVKEKLSYRPIVLNTMYLILSFNESLLSKIHGNKIP